MPLTVISNPDESKRPQYTIARVLYAETGATSLRAVECLASMIANISRLSGVAPEMVVMDSNLFDVHNAASPNHQLLSVAARGRGFDMCLRVAVRLLHGTLSDQCCGATKFHHADTMPDWAVSRGYILAVDDLLFYL